MHRLPDWEARLGDYLEQVRETPFRWGRHDCAMFSAGAVQAMTGVDPAPEMRGRYSTARGSVYAARKYGAGTLAATLDAKFAAVAPALAQRGDLVMSDGAVGVTFGPAAVFVGREGERAGLVREAMPAAGWDAAWRVPFETTDA